MRVAVVGCGTAGPSAALNIVRRLGRHWTVELFDKAPKPSAVGAGIGLQPIGMTAVNKLGISLFGTVLKHGARIDSIKTWSTQSQQPIESVGVAAHQPENRRPVLDVAYARYDQSLFGLGLHRGVLFHALLDECLVEPEVLTRFGVEVTEIEHGPNSATLRDATGTAHGPYDLVVLADGTNSRLRGKLGVPHRFSRYAYGALFALLPDDARTFGTALTQVHAGPGCHTTLGFLPTGHAHGEAGGTFRTTLYYNLRHDEYAAWREGGLDAWKRQCAALMPEAEPLLAQITSMDQLAFASYSDGTMWRFHGGGADGGAGGGGRVVCIGDVSHSMSPQLGQGANLAMIDAEKLVDALVEAQRSPSQPADALEAADVDLPKALAAYTRDRWSRVVFYQAQSRLLTPLFASRSELLRALRDTLTYPALMHTPLRTYAHAVLCGAQSPSLMGTIPKEEYLGFLKGLEQLGISGAEAGVR